MRGKNLLGLWMILYLVFVATANVIIGMYGKTATIWVALIFIGPVFTLRDAIHENSPPGTVTRRIFLLILGGGMLSWLLTPAAGRVAFASMLAFLLSESIDALVYIAAHRYSWTVKSNVSNSVGALVDSLVFPLVAFGAFLPGIIAGQLAAKVVGGFIWVLVISIIRTRRQVVV